MAHWEQYGEVAPVNRVNFNLGVKWFFMVLCTIAWSLAETKSWLNTTSISKLPVLWELWTVKGQMLRRRFSGTTEVCWCKPEGGGAVGHIHATSLLPPHPTLTIPLWIAVHHRPNHDWKCGPLQLPDQINSFSVNRKENLIWGLWNEATAFKAHHTVFVQFSCNPVSTAVGENLVVCLHTHYVFSNKTEEKSTFKCQK